MDKNALRQLRLRLNMTQQQLATEIGIAMSTLSRWERGEGVPRGAALKLLQALSKSSKRPASK